MSAKNGSLNDGREVYFREGKVTNFLSEPVFSQVLEAIQRCKLREKDPFVSQAIQNPQIDHSRGLQELFDNGEELSEGNKKFDKALEDAKVA